MFTTPIFATGGPGSAAGAEVACAKVNEENNMLSPRLRARVLILDVPGIGFTNSFKILWASPPASSTAIVGRGQSCYGRLTGVAVPAGLVLAPVVPAGLVLAPVVPAGLAEGATGDCALYASTSA